jgi:diketogulonate reductase-like aldo/keto reductase
MDDRNETSKERLVHWLKDWSRGACFPLGYNESIQQAKAIIGYYNSLQPSKNAITQLDLLLVHWPVNYGPCPLPAGKTIPTTDPACNNALPTYNERTCRVSTWRGMVAAWKMGLTRSIGVSNWNSKNMQDLVDASLPLPAVNQINWQPGFLKDGVQFIPYPHDETFVSELAWCQEHHVLVNGYSPFGGRGQAGQTFAKPDIKLVAAAHNVSAAQAILRWNVQLGTCDHACACV